MYQAMRNWISENCPDNLQCFDESCNDPASPDQIEKLASALGTPMPDHIRSAFETANGTSKSILTFSPWRPISVEESIRIIEGYSGMSVIDEHINQVDWQRHWLPFTSDICGDLICLCVNPNADQNDVGGMPEPLFDDGQYFIHRGDENQVTPAQDWMDVWTEEIIERAS